MTTETFDPAYLLERMRNEDNIVGKPVITMTWDGYWMVFSEDERAEHPEYELTIWPDVMYGSGEGYKTSAERYAKQWAEAVGGVVEYE